MRWSTRIRLAGVLCGVAAIALTWAQRSPETLVHELGPGVLYWQGDELLHVQTNVGWAIFKDFVLVVDANFPWGAREILPAIQKTTDRPIRFVINTHYHADHSYGNIVFQRAGAGERMARHPESGEGASHGPAGDSGGAVSRQNGFR